MKTVSSKSLLVLCLGTLGMFLTSFMSCSDAIEESNEKFSASPAKLIKDAGKLKMLRSIQDLDDGRLFYLNYTEDYKLDQLVNLNVTTNEGLVKYVIGALCDVPATQKASLDYGAGCSAFSATTPDKGDFIMGRNFDYSHGNEPIAAALVQTSPKDGLKSICMVDGYWIGYRQNLYHCFTEQKDSFERHKEQDLSYIMGFPYLLMDGMNEAGFAICVLHLDGKPTQQVNTGKKLTTTVAMRYLLDHVRSVDHAVELLRNYDLHVPNGNGNYHFFMADASGKYAVIEYVYDENHREAKFIDDEIYDDKHHIKGFKYPDILPNVMEVMADKRCVSNFYLSSAMNKSEKGALLSKHGKTRYDIMDFVLTQNDNKLSEERAMSLLNDVSQAESPTDVTSHTQWSVVYNLTECRATVCINRNYEHKFTFRLK